MSDVNFSFPVDELAAALLQKLIPFLPKEYTPEPLPQPEYLTRKETAAKLKISLPTLGEYTKQNLIKSYRVGVRVLYKQCEIGTVLNHRNYGATNV